MAQSIPYNGLPIPITVDQNKYLSLWIKYSWISQKRLQGGLGNAEEIGLSLMHEVTVLSGTIFGQTFHQNLSFDSFEAFCINFLLHFLSSWPLFSLFLDIFDPTFLQYLRSTLIHFGEVPPPKSLTFYDTVLANFTHFYINNKGVPHFLWQPKPCKQGSVTFYDDDRSISSTLVNYEASLNQIYGATLHHSCYTQSQPKQYLHLQN